MTTSIQNISSTSLSDDHLKTNNLAEYRHCPECGKLADYSNHPLYDLDPLKAAYICRCCGHINYDLSVFYIIHTLNSNQNPASPSFSTEAEAKQFGEILGLKKSDGYQLKRGIAEFNGEHDQQARLELINQLSSSAEVLATLVDQPLIKGV